MSTCIRFYAIKNISLNDAKHGWRWGGLASLASATVLLAAISGCASTARTTEPALPALASVPAPPLLAQATSASASPSTSPATSPATSTSTSLSAKGRVSVTTQGIKGVQQLHGLFELVTDVGGGRLELLTPLGGTLAIMVWTPTSAVLRRASGELQSFDSPAEMVQLALGVQLAPNTLVQWLRGEPLDGQPIQSLGPSGFTQLGWRVSSVRAGDASTASKLNGYPKRIDLSRAEGASAEVRLVLDEVTLPVSQVDPKRPLAIK